MYVGPMPTRPPTLLEIQKRADRLVGAADAQVKTIVSTLSPDEDFVGVLFDGSDSDGMMIYHELGFVEGQQDTLMVMDLALGPFLEALRKHKYNPIDEHGWDAGTVPLYVFTMNAVIGRRFVAGPELRPVRRSRDVEFVGSPRFTGRAAVDFVIDTCKPLLKQLDRTGDRVAVIEERGHGARVSYLARDGVVTTLRTPSSAGLLDVQEACRKIADCLEATPGKINCVISGWDSAQLVRLDPGFFNSGAAAPGAAGEERDEAFEIALACRDQTRVLGLLKKRLEKMPASPVKSLLAELVSVVRDNWQSCDAVLAKVAAITNAPSAESDDVRLLEVLAALTLATDERKRGAPLPKSRVTATLNPCNYSVEPGTHSGLVIAPREQEPLNLPLTPERAMMRLGRMMEALQHSLPEAVRKLDDDRKGETWAVVLFDESDKRAMEVYRKLGPKWEPLPRGGLIAVACTLDRLEKTLVASGYKQAPNQWGTYVPGCVRVVGLSLGIVMVQQARAIEMVPPGTA